MNLIRKGLFRNPVDRPGSAKDFSNQLRSYIKDKEPEFSAERLRKLVKQYSLQKNSTEE